MPEQMYDDQTSDPGAERRYPEYGAAPALARPTPRHDRNRWLAFLLIGLGVAMLLANLGRFPFSLGSFERTQTYGVDISLDGVEMARLHVDWGSGPLQLSGGDGRYIVRGSVEGKREPDVEVDDGGDLVEVTIDDGDDGWLFRSSGGASGHLLLGSAVPYHLALELGSGQAGLDLSDVRVEELELDASSGSVALVLPNHGPGSVAIDGGSGSVAIRLSPDLEARIVVDQGSGSFDPGERLEQIEGDEDDQIYETPGYASSSAGIEVEIDGGSGAITIR